MLSLKPSRVIAGKYRLDQELARGGMGSLWVAFDRRLRRKVAIKFINSMAAEIEEAHSRFEREARAAAAIRSAHVVQTYDYGTDRGHAYIVMELLEGEDLGARLARERRLPLQTVSKILSQIAKGLDAVHAAGIVHRDLKPANIFVSIVGGEETIKLIDFGVARSEVKDGRRTTARGALLGTVKYMGPEQALGETTLDHRADLWSLAVIIYRLLTGNHPFRGATVDELVLSICRDPVPAPSTVLPSLPPGIDAFFERAFSRTLDERFHSAQQMSSAFLAAFSAARNGTLPWGARMPTIQERERMEDPTRQDVGLAEEYQGPSRESLDDTQLRADALPPARGILPSDYTPVQTMRKVPPELARKRWWLASVPAAVVVVVSAVVFGITAGRPPAIVSPRSAPVTPETTVSKTSQKPPPGR